LLLLLYFFAVHLKKFIFYATLKDTIAQSLDMVMYHITKLQTNVANCKQCHNQSVQK